MPARASLHTVVSGTARRIAQRLQPCGPIESFGTARETEDGIMRIEATCTVVDTDKARRFHSGLGIGNDFLARREPSDGVRVRDGTRRSQPHRLQARPRQFPRERSAAGWIDAASITRATPAGAGAAAPPNQLRRPPTRPQMSAVDVCT
jgi:hypothetical protein